MSEQSIDQAFLKQHSKDTDAVAGAVWKLAKLMLEDTANIGERVSFNCDVEVDSEGYTFVTFTFKKIEEPVGLFLPQGV